jgi:hypothetical protein
MTQADPMSVLVILVIIALLLAIVSLFPTASNWPLIAVSMILVCVARLVGKMPG